jgi:hypothetical protein
LIVKAASLGITVTEAMIKGLAAASTETGKMDGSTQRTASRIKNYLNPAIEVATKVMEQMAAAAKNAGTAVAGLTNIEKYDKAYAIIKNFFDAQEALIRRQRKSEADLLQAKIDNAQKDMDLAQEKIDKQQEIIDLNNREVDLLNRKIELNYDRPIQKLQDESTILNNNLEIIRNHWGIEINLHWCLDVSFNEDGACVVLENAVINGNIFRKYALNVHQAVKKKESMKTMFRLCANPLNAIKILDKIYNA